MSYVAAKIQQNCTGTGNYNSKATRQGIICVQVPVKVTERSHLKGNSNFSECLEIEKPTGKSCKSMFYPNSYNEDSRFVLKSSQKIQPA